VTGQIFVLLRDCVIFWVRSSQWFKNVLDVEVGEIMSIILHADVGFLLNPNENKP